MRIFALLSLFSLLVHVPLPAQTKQPVNPKDFNPAGPYSASILSGGTLYISGTVGRDKAGKYPEEFEAEMKQALENIGNILKAAKMDFSNAVTVTVYLTDMTLFERMNKVYLEAFPEPRPARTTVGVAKLVGPARIEITVTAR